MKNFLLALFLLAAVLVFSLVHAGRVTAELSETEALLSQPNGGNAVYERLLHGETLLTLSANHLLWETAVQASLDLSACETADPDSPETLASRKKLLHALRELAAGEKCAFSVLL